MQDGSGESVAGPVPQPRLAVQDEPLGSEVQKHMDAVLAHLPHLGTPYYCCPAPVSSNVSLSPFKKGRICSLGVVDGIASSVSAQYCCATVQLRDRTCTASMLAG